MEKEQPANGSPFAKPRRFIGVSFSLACSISISTPPIMASSPAAPIFHASVQPSYTAAHTAAAHTAAAAHLRTNKLQNTAVFSQTAGSHDLNLASSQTNILASSLGGFHNLTIVVGGQKETVSLGSRLTGAETVAAEQVLSSGHQTIKIAVDGEATGGTISLNSSMISALDNALGGSINTLTVSHGVKIIDSLGLLTLSGTLDNDGSILTASATAHATDTIAANSIVNAAGGVITSYTSAGSALFAADPSLSALTSINNSGTISSSANLTLTAPAVYNMASADGGGGLISARQNLVINSALLTNAGLIGSSSGNVSFVSNNAALNFINNGGSVKALDGDINFTSNNAAIDISGGNLLSKQLDIKAEAGAISVDADNVSGVINASGDSVHVFTESNQILGNIDTSGDPGFVSPSTITITGTMTTSAGADLAIISGGNILSGSKAVINTSPTTSGNGGNLTLIAGANVTGPDTSAIVASGAGSTTGGIIDLTGKNGGTGAVSAITTAGGGTAGNGGYIEMVAYVGTAPTTTNTGSIILPTKVIVDAAGIGVGTSGAVTMIAGATSGTAITTGPIVGGQVQLLSETPSAAAGGVTFTNGTSSAGIGGFTGTANSTTASILAGTITSSKGVTITTGGSATTGIVMADGSGTGVSGTAGGAGGAINISATGNIITGELDAFGGGGVGGGTSGSLTGGAGGAGGTIDLSSTTGSIAVTGNVNVSGGGGGGGAGSTTNTANAGGAGGKAGSVTLSANNSVTVSGEVFAYDGGAGAPGGTSLAGAGGGGGGGGSYGGAGGGGAGAVSSSAGQNAGGGGGGGSLIASGGGGAGSSGGGGTATGGDGGGYVLLGVGGQSTTTGSNGVTASKTAGGAGGKASTIKGGTGGATPKGGGGGASAFSSGDGSTGAIAQVKAGDGTLTLATGGGSVGTLKAPLKFEAGALEVTTTGLGAAYLSDISGQQVNVTGITTASTGTVVLATKANTITASTGGIIDITGAVMAGYLNLSTAGLTADIDINAAVNSAGSGVTTLTTTGSTANVNITNVLGGTVATITTLGTITTSGSGSINAATVTLTAPKTITVTTDAGNLTVTDHTAAVTITQGANTLNLIGSTAVATGTNPFTVDSSGQINVIGTIGGSATSVVTLDSTGASGGIEIANIITGGTVNITSAGSGGITATTTAKITAGVISLTSATNTGSSTEPIIVYNNLALGKGNTLNIATGSTGSAYVTDLGTTDLSLNATSTSSGLLSVSSAAVALNVVQAPFANINLTDTSAAGIITLNSGSSTTALIGNGNGVVTVNSKGSILMNANTAGIEGKTVNLNSTAGDVGGEIGLVVNSLNINSTAIDGQVNITTNETGTINFSGGAGVQLQVFTTAANANLILNGNLPINNILVRQTGATSSITTNGLLGISDKDVGNVVQLEPTNNLTINGNIIADDVFLGSNKFTGDPVLLGTVLVNGTITTDQTVLIPVNQSKGITVNAPITGNVVRLMSDVGDINLNASITTKTNPEDSLSYIVLSSAGANINVQPGIALTATGAITIDMSAGTAAIGTAASPILMKAPNINLDFSGNVYVTNSQAVVLTATSNATTGVFQFNNTIGAVTFEGAVSSGNITISSAAALSLGEKLDSSSATLTSSGALNLTGVGAVTNYGELSASAVDIVGSSFSNINPTGTAPPPAATLSANTSLSISNPNGALAIIGPSGSITSPAGAGGSLSLNALGAITIGSATNDPLSDITTTPLHAVTINAGGNLSVGWPGIDVVPDSSGNGGIINIKADNIIDNGTKLTQAFFLTANGATAAGSTIILDLPGATGGITTGSAVGDYNISAKGTNGAATIEIVSGGNLTANMSNLIFNGTAASGTPTNVILEAAGKLLINGTFTTKTGTGAFGSITLSAGSNTPFVVGGAAGTTNGIIGQSLIGSTVSISDNAGITINPTYSVQATSGTLTLNTTNLINNGSVNTSGILTISNSGNIIFPTTGSGTYTMAGLIVDSINGNVTVANDTAFTSPNLLSTLEFLAPKGTLTLPSSLTALTVKAQSSGVGGTLELAAKTFKTSVTTFTAAGTTGAGGTIVYISNGSTPITVGGTGGLVFNAANGGTAAGGAITVANSGNLTVDTSGLNLGSGSGANLTLEAGTATAKGILLISNLANLKQPFDNLYLLSNSATAFSLGGATTKTNGIVDSGVTVTGQTITIANQGGAIIQGTGGTLTATGTSKNALNLVAGKTGIGISSSSPLNVSALNLGITTSGSAFVNNLNAGAASLDTVSVSKVLDYSSTGSIATAGTLLVPSLTLSVSAVNPAISTNATSLNVAATSGNVTINDLATTVVTVNNLTSSGIVGLTSAGAITTSATAILSGSTIALTAGGKVGNIIIGNNLSAAGGTIDLTAAGTGTINESSKTAVITADILNLTTAGGAIGTSATKALLVDANVLDVNTGSSKTASAYINNSATTASLGTTTVGNIFDYSGSITGASGPIAALSLILSLTNETGSIATSATTLQASAAAGNINLVDSQTGLVKVNAISAAAGQVTVSSGGAVTTASTINAAGNINVSAGGSGGTLTIGGNITSTGGSDTLIAVGTGSILESKGLVSAGLSTGAVTLTTAGGNIGASTKAVTTNASVINLTGGTTGNAYVTNTDLLAAGKVDLSSTNLGSLKFTETNTTAKNTGTLTVNGINAQNTTSSAITIITNEQTLDVAASSTLKTVNGNITLQNTYTANGTNLPLISIGNNVVIHASSTGSATTGNVFIALGTVPTAATVRPGLTPTTPTITITGSTTKLITFGSTANLNGSITNGTGDTLTSDDRNLSFSTGKNLATQIVLGNTVAITADPPAGVNTLPVTQTLLSDLSSNVSANQNSLQNSKLNIVTIQMHDQAASVANGNLIEQAFLPALLSTSSTQAQMLSAVISQSDADELKSFTGNLPMQAKHLLQSSKIAKSTLCETLENGASLFAPKQNTVVQTPFGNVTISADCIAMIITSKEGLAVYDLHDVRKNSIFIECDKTQIALMPGRSAMITHKNGKEFEKINPAEKVGYKNISARSINNAHQAYEGDFEIFSMVRSLSPLRKMLVDDASAKRKTAAKMIKTAAILSQLSNGETYRLYAPQEMTASLPQNKH